ncbi:MAG: T9SS type A sorting domain-containing protein, partial [Hymenobacter sp.]
SVAFAEVGQAGSAITVINAQGQRLLHFTTEASTADALNLPVEKLGPGVYIVQVQVVGQSPRYARFVKQ